MVYVFSILDVKKTLDNNAVFETQVLGLANYLANEYHEIYIVGSYTNEKNLANKVGANSNIKLKCYRHRSFLVNVVIHTIKVLTLPPKVDIFYSRGIWGFLPIVLNRNIAGFFRMKRGFLVYDVRGDILDESMLMGSNIISLKRKYYMERFCVINADYVYTVSSKLSSLIRDRYKLKSEPRVIPSCVDITDFKDHFVRSSEMRSELGFSESDLVFTFSSGIGAYQCVSEVVTLFDQLCEVSCNIKLLLFLGGSDSQINLRISGNKNVVLLSCSRKEVIKRLQICDIGILYRENRSLNNVASPIKFSEYLASGLAPLVSVGIGDVSDSVSRMAYGYVIDNNSIELKEIVEFIEKVRRRRIETCMEAKHLAENYYCWQAFSGRLYNAR
jgi:glycosyltransferase involved in cell wall biosynthesis